MAGVPANADILAAYLYWETIDLPGSANLNPLTTPVKFRGQPVTDANVKVVKGSSVPGIGASCYSSGTPLTLTMFRADVLHLLKSDPNVKKPERRLVNDADLQANGFGLNTVTLPEAGNGNNAPQSAGASLFVVYRDPAEPLRKIVVYDGVYVQPSLDVPMTQTLRGFYQSASGKSAKITHIVAAGQKNTRERMFFNDSPPAIAPGTQIAPSATFPTDPFPNAQTSSDRAWASPTIDVSSLMTPRNNFGDFGETATTTVDHSGGGSYDCLTWAAVIFSTAVADVDHDGIPDGLEDAAGGLKDPKGTDLFMASLCQI